MVPPTRVTVVDPATKDSVPPGAGVAAPSFFVYSMSCQFSPRGHVDTLCDRAVHDASPDSGVVISMSPPV